MKAIKNMLKKVMNNKVVVSLALMVVTLAEVSQHSCVIFIIGQDDMPEELL